jgi:hypothetical protein
MWIPYSEWVDFVDVLENTIISFFKASHISMITFQNVLSAAYLLKHNKDFRGRGGGSIGMYCQSHNILNY